MANQWQVPYSLETQMPPHLLTAGWTHRSFVAEYFHLHKMPPVFVLLTLHESSADFPPVQNLPEPASYPTPDNTDTFSRFAAENPVRFSPVPAH